MVTCDVHLPHVDNVRLPKVSVSLRLPQETAYMTEVFENFILDLKTMNLAQQLYRLHSGSTIGRGLSEGFICVLVMAKAHAS